MNGSAPAELSAAGSLLGQSARLLLRHGLNVALSLVAFAAGSLLAVYVAGRCFPSTMPACVAPRISGWFGDNALEIQYTAGTTGTEIVGRLVVTLALLVLFLLADPVPGRAQRPVMSVRRGLGFAGRAVVYWLVLLVPGWIFGFLVDHLIAAAVGDQTLLGAWLSFLVVMPGGLLAVTYLHARIVFFLPSAFYDERPRGFLECWRATRGSTAALFKAFLALEIVGTLIYLAFWYLGPLIPELTALSEPLARWSGVEASAARYIVPVNIGELLSGALVGITSGAISVVAYRTVLAREYQLAAVFE